MLKYTRIIMIFMLICSASDLYARSMDDKFIIGTHYYGLKSYSWPINYLNAIRDDEIDSELKIIKKMGFNTIFLLVSWAEFESEPGVHNEAAYDKLNKIIATAKSNNLDVALRVPYLWSLISDGRIRLSYALLGQDKARKQFFEFLNHLDSSVINQNSNIISKFGSWEDFYVVRDIFFSNEPMVSDYAREVFTKETGVDASAVVMNGNNYDIFLAWLDSKIEKLSKEISQYGYEIRIDADVYENNGTSKWYSHNKFYANKSGGSVFTYWAPYFGQKNEGEKLSAEETLKSFSWMLDLIAEKTNSLPVVGQLNFYETSPNTDHNAEINEGQIGDFFNILKNVLTSRTSGYALWTIKDYSHNLIFNTAFSEGLSGWGYSEGVRVLPTGVKIPSGGYIAQSLPAFRVHAIGSETASLIVNVTSGNGKIYYGDSLDVSGPGEYRVELNTKALSEGLDIKVSSDLLSVLEVKSVRLDGHKQVGKVLTSSGEHSKFYNVITDLNVSLQLEMDKPCLGYSHKAASMVYNRGLYDDGWTKEKFSLCLDEVETGYGVEFKYFNPSTAHRKISFNSAAESYSFDLNAGVGKIRICEKNVLDNMRYSFNVYPAYLPEGSDVRTLGVLITDIQEVSCSSEMGVRSE